MSGLYETEYLWALNHKDVPCAKSLLDLASLYSTAPFHPTLGLIQGAVCEVKKAMLAERKATP